MGAEDNTKQQPPQEPRGFGERTRGLAGEYAHEQGWGLDVDERTKQPDAPQDIDGGGDYNYGARDFGDDPVNTGIAADQRDQTQNKPSPERSDAEKETHTQQEPAQRGAETKE